MTNQFYCSRLLHSQLNRYSKDKMIIFKKKGGSLFRIFQKSKNVKRNTEKDVVDDNEEDEKDPEG